jgi:hypothetical protein
MVSAKLLLILALLGGLIEDANKAPSDSVINVSAGSYPGGTITNDVILIANGDAKFTGSVILKGAVTLDGFVFGDRNGQLIEVRASGCVIRNCTFRRFGKSGSSKAIWIREQARYDNTLIDNCLFDDWSRSSSHSSCVKVSQSGGAQHQGTIIRNCTSSNGADGGNSVAFQLYAPTLVEDNLIHHVEDAIEVKGNNCIIRRNHLHDNTGSEQLSNRDGDNNLFEGNYVHDCEGWPAQVFEGYNVTFINNVIAYCSKGVRFTGTVPNRYSGSGNILFAHNTLVGLETTLEDDSRQTTPPQGLTIVNNIMAAGGWSLPNSLMGGAGYNLYFGVTPSAIREGDVFADPLFIDLINNDFHLLADSPARNAGFDLGIATDYDGTARVAPFDIGAFEIAAPQVPPELLARKAELETQIAALQIELAEVDAEIATYQQ